MRTRRLMAAVTATVLLAGACSDDDDPAASTTSTPAAPTTTAAVTTTAAPTTTASTEPVLYGEPGPYAAGVTTIDLGDRQTEVWYPVDPESVAGLEPESFSVLEVFPPAIQERLTGVNSTIDTSAYRDQPATIEHGPYPVVVYSHGSAGYRKIATFHMDHLASWGFVVASTDHLERGLLAAIGLLEVDEDRTQDEDDIANTVTALEAASEDDQSVLAGAVDADRVAVMGHSAGGFAAAQVAADDDSVGTFVSWTAGGDPDAEPQPTQPAQFVAADNDVIVEVDRIRSYYESLESPRRLVVLDNAGHDTFTDACALIWEAGGLGEVADALGLPENLVALGDDGCTPNSGFTHPDEFQPLLNHLTTAQLFEVFGLGDTTGSLDPVVADAFPGLVESFETAGFD